MIEDLNIMKFGTLSLECGENPTPTSYLMEKKLAKYGDSSITHIKYKGEDFLVDTGYAHFLEEEKHQYFNERSLEFHLGFHDLHFKDIVGIFITHWHADHFANLNLFPNAQIFTYDPKKELYLELAANSFQFKNLLPVTCLKDGDEFAGCKVLATPGHTKLHCSLLAEIWKLKIVIAGDAIVSQSYYDNDKTWPYNAGNMGPEACKKSMDEIIKIADFIIPGHGHPFQNYKKIR